MAAARYWRINITGSSGTNSLVRELRMFDARNGSNLCTGGNPIGNGSNLAQAFDGNTASGGASSTTFPHQVGYDFGLGNDKDLTHITIFSTVSETPRFFTVERSSDNSTWTVASRVASLLASNNTELYYEAQTVQPPTPTNADGHTLAMRAMGAYEPLTFGPALGSIGVTVLEAGIPVRAARVHVHLRSSGALVARGNTNASGQVTFTQLDQTSDNYYVIAFDPDGGTAYNALIYDRVTPS